MDRLYRFRSRSLLPRRLLAEESLLRVLELKPEETSTRLMLAHIYMRDRDHERLLEQLDAYLRGNPGGPELHRVLQMRFDALNALADTHEANRQDEDVYSTLPR